MTNEQPNLNEIYQNLYEQVTQLREAVYQEGQDIYDSWQPDTLRLISKPQP
ncbi:hypothetical protein [Aerococcus sp. 1KP-2016]|uniref:hypothetical protein n=1 Tax=Aerococcus sp. 1KP-2016 TaxID=1981982 RepID=UPI001F29DFC1|nr:hypothetical protein [Aerococcus sp. 1KP-2016]